MFDNRGLKKQDFLLEAYWRKMITSPKTATWLSRGSADILEWMAVRASIRSKSHLSRRQLHVYFAMAVARSTQSELHRSAQMEQAQSLCLTVSVTHLDLTWLH